MTAHTRAHGKHGDFAIEKSARMVQVAGDPAPISVQALLIGANGVDAFVGINGPAANEGAGQLHLGIRVTVLAQVVGDGVDGLLELWKVEFAVLPRRQYFVDGVRRNL